MSQGASGVLANVMGGVLALLLIGYLFVALVRPEKF
jgi:K+-transporting ATPase KdpF subunit